MFKSFVRTVGLSCLASVVLLATEAQGAATVSLKAIKKNNVAIAATNSISVVRGDVITAEVYYSGWSTPLFDPPSNTGLVQTYQGTLLGAAGAISSGANSTVNDQLVLPVGWVAPVVRENCSAGCPNPPYTTCDPFYGCVGAGHAPEKMVRVCVGGTLAGLPCGANAECTGGGSCPPINIQRNDYMFFGFGSQPAVDVSSLNVRWGSTTFDSFEVQTASRCQGGTNAGGTCTTVAQCPGAGASCNANFLSYGGTLNLKVGTQACGVYTFNLANNIDATFINNPDPVPIPALPATVGLTITVTGPGATCAPATGACCNETTGVCTDGVLQVNCPGRFGGNFSTCATINPACVIVPQTGACCNESTGVCTNNVTQASCTGRYGGNNSTCATLNPPCPSNNTIIAVSPTHCTIDARRPFAPNTPNPREGFKAMTFTFANPLGTGEDAPADFQVTQFPPQTPPILPTINNPVVPGPGNTLTLNFNVPINTNHWTCVRHIASNSRRCIGYLSGDVNSNGAAAPSDILTIIDNLNGVIAPLLPSSCDIDRSGACAPADILTEIDLLNGTNGFPVQNGDTIEACPSTTP